jgi:hypothetical protein
MSAVYVREIPEYRLDGLPLGRHVEHDDRSRGFAITAPERLRSVSLTPVRHERFIPVLDQGQIRSCTGNAGEGAAGTGALYQALPHDLPARPSDQDRAVDEDQALALYSAATRLDGIPGQYLPDDTGSTGLAVAKVMKRAGLIAGYQHTFSLADALYAAQIVPLLTGFNWYDSFDQPDSNGTVRITPGAQVRGGHEPLLDELLVDERMVGFTNSWSGDWGLHGRFYLSWADFDRLLGEQGDVTVPVPLGNQPPQPPPGPDPQPQPQPSPDDVDRQFWATAQTWAKARGLA